VQEAIDRSFGRLGIRIYGGHFFVAGGRLDFIGCLFYDMEILTPMTDRLRFGDDVFVSGRVSVFSETFGGSEGRHYGRCLEPSSP
jgi:hypothetical protein